jgi:cob(I)alamin adenosyltransferase
MKIYTKKGDAGQTSLFGGQKVQKSEARIAAYGTVDELNSVLGVALTKEHSEQTAAYLKQLQYDLFVLGADLATPISKETRIDRITANHIEFLEQSIDEMEGTLPPLKNFILPGGTEAGALLHFARTVCRRAERHAVECSQSEEISALSIAYLNRLSDFLFVLGRFENNQSGTEETPWIPT